MILLPVRKIKRRSVAFIKNKLFGKALVLIYHRVIDLENDPQQLAVSVENFEKQIVFLKRNFNILPLAEVVSNLKQGTVVNKSITITFDDGYYDNRHFALPVLESLNIPATFFISTNYIDKADEFWWDKLESLILLPATLPSFLELHISNEQYSWQNCNEQRNLLYLEIHNILKRQPILVVQTILDQLISWSGVDFIPRPNYRPLNRNELIEMANSQVVEIGTHTMSHCRLSNETAENQYREIAESGNLLKRLLNKEIRSFSYPFGSASDYSAFTPELVQQAGYSCGISNNQHFVTKQSNAYILPRFLIRDWDLEEFEIKIKNMFRFGPE